MRIELTTEAWEAPILPLNYARTNLLLIVYYILNYLTSVFCRLEKFF